MTKPDTILILDDNQSIVDSLLKFILPLPQAKDISFKGFTHDSEAHEFVLQHRESVLGYIQDIIRSPDIWDTSGIRFFNQVIDCFTPWAKTLIFSACCDVHVPTELFKRAGDKLHWLSKSEFRGSQTLIPELEWLITPLHAHTNAPDTATSAVINILSPAWDKLCAHLTTNPEDLHRLNPRDFEYLAGEIFRSYGWGVDFTSRTRDGGYDIIATRRSKPTDLCVLIQAKRYNPDRPVGVEIVRSLYGLRLLRSASQVVLVTSSHITKDAKREFQRVIPWELDFIERDRILEWCKTYSSVLFSGYLQGKSLEESNEVTKPLPEESIRSTRYTRD